MPYKNYNPLLPFLDPEFDPNHPIHGIALPPDDPYLPRSKSETRRLLKAATEEAIQNYSPSHVLRSYEIDTFRKDQYDAIMALRLGPKWPSDAARERVESRPSGKIVYLTESVREAQSPWSESDDPYRTDFRQFAVRRLHLNYLRFHESTDEEEEPDASRDPVDTPEPDVCWIMEYTETECNNIRRALAHALGLYPAATDNTTSAYNEEIAWRYERRLKSRCRRRNKKCIRPSHIELFTQCGRLLP